MSFAAVIWVVGRGGRKAEASGVGGDTGVQAVGNVRGDVHAHGADDRYTAPLPQRGLAVQQGKISVAAVARVVVDAKIDNVAGILGHPLLPSPKSWMPATSTATTVWGSNSPLNRRGVGKRIPGGDDVGAEDSHVLVQSLRA